ncbi:MAG: 3-methyl-2-oxobutanoate dehydrogenase subunit VorB [Defluviitaleaceae bacterium]|nr:3-methyl-2-oxobutanoate dehydrogenase subunit VorB [Defluviitaleaceae bacterium]
MNRELMKGNEAIAEAAIKCGCRYFFGYPITPQNEIPEYMSLRMPQVGGAFVQAESEVAAINMVYGAAGCGARVITSSSGPGMSLKMEGISYIAGAELPCVIVNIMRAGPGLGGIQPSQSDYFQTVKGGGHGDYNTPVLAPSNLQEAVDFTQLAFDIAEKYRTPVIILGDGLLGQMMEPVVIEEKKPLDIDRSWASTGWDGKSRKPARINSLNLNTEDLDAHNAKLQAKYKTIKENEVRYKEYKTEDAEILVVAYGTSGRISYSAVDEAREAGVKVGVFCPLTLWPFPEKQLFEAAKGKKAVVVVEMSAGQMLEDVKLNVPHDVPVHFFGKPGGSVPSSEAIAAEIKRIKEVC